ncbi:hypothetical protein SBA5_470090 [Candidatus Sulfotelmatomonas gaucii]|uniref:Uncharacterized protein n=1 Tax=Candidatus Sulfuritelmatomonas gaucii TaxID=2043161 RepID=A0A2N9LNZ0_9BACT|nr:hypothetical protein SBA5_470090 [Candidatus Sulfotelmatomonas gaucii]
MVRAASQANLEKAPKQRWTIGSNKVAAVIEPPARRHAASFLHEGLTTDRRSLTTVLQKYLLNPQPEQPRQLERQRQAGIELPRLNSVDRLPRHFQPLGQIALRPVPLSAQHLQAVLHHRYLW